VIGIGSDEEGTTSTTTKKKENVGLLSPFHPSFCFHVQKRQVGGGCPTNKQTNKQPNKQLYSFFDVQNSTLKGQAHL
jgi:hypothetical protein